MLDLAPIAFLLLLVPLSLVFLSLWWKARGRLRKLEVRFEPILDIEKEVAVVRLDKGRVERDTHELREAYAKKKAIYDRLLEEVAIFDEKVGFAQLGIYSPHFEFSDSEQFKAEIENVRAAQKVFVSDKTAIKNEIDWVVGGSKREGQKMTGRAARLSLRAFNKECDSAIANTRWNNVTTMEKRIRLAFVQINKLNETLQIAINDDFLQLKLKELWLTHEYREKQKEERDHRAEMSRLKREEERLLKDAAAAMKDEKLYEELLAKAVEEATAAVGPRAAQYEVQIAELRRELEIAHQKAERAKSMAEQTRAGHIYVISNVGSFGEGVYKIGMTRRLDPRDRVRELGDASVPFLFDTHAMIYCEDAPAIEKELHNVFDQRRVNKANTRKEFFKASLEEIETTVRRFAPEADFITGIEAQEYQETLAMIHTEAEAAVREKEAFPIAI